MKYLVKTGSNSNYGKEFYSTSRNAKQHIYNNYGVQGGAWCNVYTADGKKQISAAKCSENKIYNVVF